MLFAMGRSARTFSQTTSLKSRPLYPVQQGRRPRFYLVVVWAERPLSVLRSAPAAVLSICSLPKAPSCFALVRVLVEGFRPVSRFPVFELMTPDPQTRVQCGASHIALAAQRVASRSVRRLANRVRVST